MAQTMDGNFGDDARLLSNYPELEEAVEITRELKESIDKFLPLRIETIRSLESLKIKVEKSYDTSRKSKIAGTVATVTGSTMAIVGFGLSFVTLGASAGIGIAGAVLAGTGGLTILGSDVLYGIYSSSSFKKAKKACEDDREKMEEFQELSERFCQKIDALGKKSFLSSERILQVVIAIAKTGKPVSKAIIAARFYQLADSSLDFFKAALGVSSSFTRLAGGARTIWSGLTIAGRVITVTSVVFDALLIPVDLGIMIKSAYDVHKYDGGKGKSNSNAANKIGTLISRLEENRNAITNFRDTVA